MMFTEKLDRLASDTGFADCMLTPGEEVVYFIGDRVFKAGFRFDEKDVSTFLDMVKQPSWPRDSNLRAVIHDHRFRINCFMADGARKAVCRLLPKVIPTPAEIRLPKKVVEITSNARSGIFVVCGQLGSGKSTTMASLLKTRAEVVDQHILTLEDPIEFLQVSRFPQQFSQREIGVDVKNYRVALESAMRQRAKTILVAEVREREEAIAVINAALSGHFIMFTIHASATWMAIESLFKLIPEERLPQTIALFPSIFRGALCQQLVEGNGRKMFAIHEFLHPCDPIATYIRQNKYQAIAADIVNGVSFGHVSFAHSLHQAIKDNIVSTSAAQDMIRAIEAGNNRPT